MSAPPARSVTFRGEKPGSDASGSGNGTGGGADGTGTHPAADHTPAASASTGPSASVGPTTGTQPEEDDALVYEASTDSDELDNDRSLAIEDAHHTMCGKWTPVTYKRPIVPMPGERHCPPAMVGSSLTSLPTHRVFVLFGGVIEQAATNDTWVYEVAAKRWVCVSTEGVSIPEPRSGHGTAAVNDDEIVLFGGADISATRYFNDVWCFNIKTRQWYPIEPAGIKPRHRWAFAMTSIESRVYIHGGESPHYEVLGDLHVYDHDPYGMASIKVPVPETFPNCEMHADHLRDLLHAESEKPAGVFRKNGFSLTGIDVAASDLAGVVRQCVSVKVTVGQRVSSLDFQLLISCLSAATGVPECGMWDVAGARQSWLPLRTIYPAPPPRMLHVAVAVKDTIVIVGGSSACTSEASDHDTHITWVLEARSLLWSELPGSADISGGPTASKQHAAAGGRPCAKRRSVAAFDGRSAGGGGAAGSPCGAGHASAGAASKQLPSPFHVTEERAGSLTGHTACAYDNSVVVYGGKVDGKASGDPTWVLDLCTGHWSALQLEGAKQSGFSREEVKQLAPPARWRHCAAAVIGIDHTVLLRDCRTITPSDNCYPLERDAAGALRSIIAQERQELKAKSGYVGLLVTRESVPHVVSTQCMVIWGGQTPARKTSAMWQLTLSVDRG